MVSLETFSKCAILIHLYNIRPEITLHFMVLGAFLVVSDVPPEPVQPMIINDNKVRMSHNHLYKIPFSLCRTFRCLFDKEESIL